MTDEEFKIFPLDPKNELVINFTPPEFNFTFHDENEQIGKLWFDRDEKIFKFEGDCDESAKKMWEFVLNQGNAWFKEKYGGTE